MLRWNQRLIATLRSRSIQSQFRSKATKSELPRKPVDMNPTRPLVSVPKIQWPPQSPPARLLLITAAILLGGHTFLTFFMSCEPAYGVSMLPTMNSFGDWVFISKYYRRGREVKVGDLVSFKHPVRTGESAIKRIVGMEGDFVLMYTPDKNEMMLQVPEGHCWVTGDNLLHSRDSRTFGPLPLALIQGKITAKFYWPKWTSIEWTWIDHDLKPGSIDDDLD